MQCFFVARANSTVFYRTYRAVVLYVCIMLRYSSISEGYCIVLIYKHSRARYLSSHHSLTIQSRPIEKSVSFVHTIHTIHTHTHTVERIDNHSIPFHPSKKNKTPPLSYSTLQTLFRCHRAAQKSYLFISVERKSQELVRMKEPNPHIHHLSLPPEPPSTDETPPPHS